MTDSGGGKGFGGSRARARSHLRKLASLEGANEKTGKQSAGGTITRQPGTAPAALHFPDLILPAVVWPELIAAGVFDGMFAANELIYFLEQMARLIQKTQRGVDEVAEQFKVRPDSPFSAWQRKIRQGAPEESAHRSRASQAFQSGSNRWAIDIVKRRDPTVFTMDHVVKAVKGRVDNALLSSPSDILDEYLKLVVDSLISDDPKIEQFSDRMRRECTAVLKKFFAKFSEPSHWTEKSIPTTMKSFPAFLRGSD